MVTVNAFKTRTFTAGFHVGLVFFPFNLFKIAVFKIAIISSACIPFVSRSPAPACVFLMFFNSCMPYFPLRTRRDATEGIRTLS